MKKLLLGVILASLFLSGCQNMPVQKTSINEKSHPSFSDKNLYPLEGNYVIFNEKKLPIESSYFAASGRVCFITSGRVTFCHDKKEYKSFVYKLKEL